MEQDIFLRSEKINNILQKHPEIGLTEIKRIPEVLDDPILIIKSRNARRGGRQNTRLVLFGSVRARNGQPVLVVLDLRPVENGLAINDMQKVDSAYTKDNDPIGFLEKSDVMYADKKRTISLLRTIGFQAPIELQLYGSLGSIYYNRQNVKLEGIPFNEVIRLRSDNDSLQNETENNRRYSLAKDEEMGEGRRYALRKKEGRGKQKQSKKTGENQEAAKTAPMGIGWFFYKLLPI